MNGAEGTPVFDELVEEWRTEHDLAKFLVAMDQKDPQTIEGLADEWLAAHGGRVPE